MGRKSRRQVPVESHARPSRVQESHASPLRESGDGGISWWQRLLVAAALCIIALLAYSDSFRGAFVLDNRPLILEDPRLLQATSQNVELIWQHTYWWPRAETRLYRPISTLSYLFNYAVLGESNRPAGYHWFNFFLHALNVVLLFALALRLIGKLWPSAFIAGGWAVHPVLTESVTNIIGRADLLAAATLLSGFLFYLKSRESKGWARVGWLAGLATVTFIGVFSKESAVAILGVVVVYELTWWKDRTNLRALALGCAAIAPAFLMLFYQRSVVMLAGSVPPELEFIDNPLVTAHFLTARLTSIVVMAKYLWLLVWPAKLSCDYSYAAIPLANGRLSDWIAWTVVLVAIAVAAWQFRGNKVAFFFAAFAFVTFLPVSNLFFGIGTIMAERFLYLPAAGFAVCVVLIIYSVGERMGSRAVAPVLLCLILVALGIRTWRRNLDWQDDVALWTSAVQSVPHSFKAHAGLALALYEAGPTDINRVIEEAEKSLTILDPLPDSLSSVDVYGEAGMYYIAKGLFLAQPGPNGRTADSQASVQSYERAQQLLKRGVAIENARDEEFREEERAGGKSDSEIRVTGPARLYADLAENSMRLGDQKTAFEAATSARLLDSDNAANYQILSTILLAEGRKDEAAVMLVEGILISDAAAPKFLETLRGLYSTGLDPTGCAIRQGARGAFLNNLCQPVHNEICGALADLRMIHRRQLRLNLADRAGQRALKFGCRPGA